MRVAVRAAVAIAFTIAVIAGCASPYEGGKKAEGTANVEQADEMFVAEAMPGGGTRTAFRTNDGRRWSAAGKTLWTVWGPGGPFTSRTVTMGKSGGYAGGGYGMVVCQGEREINGEMLPTMLVVMVNNEGQYIVGRAIGGTFEGFGWWRDTPHLWRGAGTSNELRLSYDADNGEYSLEINGRFTESFRDGGEPPHGEGRDGYIVVITPYDRFPQDSVDVYFVEDR